MKQLVVAPYVHAHGVTQMQRATITSQIRDGIDAQQCCALRRKEPLVHVAEVIVRVDGCDVDGDVTNGMRAVDDGDDVVGAKETRELSNGQDNRGVSGNVADDAASDVERRCIGLEEGSQRFDKRGVALKRPLCSEKG